MISPLSFEYLTVRFFIKVPAFAPIPGSDYPNVIAALRKTHRDNSTVAPPDAEQTRFFSAVTFVDRNHPERIEEGSLRFREANSMFGQI